VRRTPLRAEIAALLCVKLLALGLLYFAFFQPAARPHADAQAVSAHVLNP